MRRILPIVFGLLLAMPAVALADTPPTGTAPASPPARAIPGITAPDSFPDACVSCHVNMPDAGIDARFGTALARWSESVDPKLVAKAQGVMPEGVTLKGKHPAAKSALASIPAKCIACHSTRAKSAPKFARLVHVVHLTGGEENHFLTFYQGQCTYCHKLNATTGAWSVPTGPER